MADVIDDGNGTSDVVDTPAAPINDYLTIALITVDWVIWQ